MSSQAIVLDNIQFYDSIKPKTDVNCYTVLATLNDYASGELLALANGTQATIGALPNDIQDCHAESLLKRAYKRYIIDKLMHEAGSSKASDISKVIGRPLTLFISQFPCGLIKRYDGPEPTDESTGLPINRKPGRGLKVPGGQVLYLRKDNCLTKLRRWLDTGVQGKKLASLICETDPVVRATIEKVVIGNCEPETEFKYQPTIDSLQQQLPNKLQYEFLDSVRRDEFVFAPHKQPQPVAVVWWKCSSGPDHRGTTEFVVDGRRRGLTKSQRLLGHRPLQISGVKLDQDFCALRQLLKTSHQRDTHNKEVLVS